MRALALAVLVSPVLAAAQSLEAAYDSAARAAGRAVPGSERLTAFHQCPERGCAYACGLTSVAFEPAP